MKPDYKNWMPKGMVMGSAIGAGVSILLLVIFGCTPLLPSGGVKTVLTIIFAVISVLMAVMTLWMFMMYRAFSYNGKRQMSRQIIESVAEYVHLPEMGYGLDVGCGSGALTIACAKRNPGASFIGIDRWGKEYASFNKALCVKNSRAEGVKNTN
ncbi:MAG TPA: SAM-dependent methyltransferase, partial [Clostridiales bacterium]|nr:SAM-dependent methyltransferase [Clostridiales bacterium]